MRKSFLFLGATVALALFILGCQPPANSNNANKPANAANGSNTANSNTSSANPEEDIKKVMTEIASELAKNDADAVSKHYTDDYTLITPQGTVQTKAERIADMKSGNSKFDSFAYENIKVRSFGDTAVATTTVRAKGKAQGRDVAPLIMATLVFRKTPEGWKVVSGQATPIAAPTGDNKTASNSNANTNAKANTNSNSANTNK